MNLFDTREKGTFYLYCGLWLEGEWVTMAGQSFAMFGLSWTDVSVLRSQTFGQASMESCVGEGSVINGAIPSSFKLNN